MAHHHIRGEVVHVHIGDEDHRRMSYVQNTQNITRIIGQEKDKGGVAEEGKGDLDEEKASTSKPPKIIRLEQILNLQDESAAYCAEGKDDAAYGILAKQYQLGASVAFLPALIDYYEVLLKTNRGDQSENVFNQLVSVIKNKVKPSIKECTWLAEKYKSKEEYFKSILFYLIGGELLVDERDADRGHSAVQSCALGIKLCVMKMAENFPIYNEVLKLHVIPNMRKMVRHISNIRGKSRKMLCMIEAICKHHVEICEGLVGDYDASEATLKESINLLENTLGEEAKEVHLYGTALNNLGATLLRQHKPKEAKDMLARAIEANMTAKDYSTDEERQKDVQRSSSAMTQAEEMLGTE